MWVEFDKELPPEGKVVDTKVDDKNGIRNEQKLMRNGRLMLFPDGSMYVYYDPTHWWKEPAEILYNALTKTK